MKMEKAAECFSNFMIMEHKHKHEWLEAKKAMFDAKIAMLKKHKDQIFDLKKKYLDKVAKGDVGQAYSLENLNTMTKIHEEQTHEWRQMCEANNKKKEAIALAHEKELESFKKSTASCDK